MTLLTPDEDELAPEEEPAPEEELAPGEAALIPAKLEPRIRSTVPLLTPGTCWTTAPGTI